MVATVPIPGGSFLPLRTERLTLRALTAADAPVLAAYRNDPEVARHQDWDLPVTGQHAEAFVASQAAVTGPVAGDWVQIGIEHDGELAGDVAVGLDDAGAVAMIGYTIRPDRQRRRIGQEAVTALVGALFDRTGVHRVAATVDPLNIASARLLERLGFRYEGCARAAAPVRGQWLDDDRYAILRSDWEAWWSRPRGRPAEVRLVEITPANARAVAQLATHRWQERFVATVTDSYRDALFPEEVNGVPVVPWLRAVTADGDLTGFVMLAEATAAHPRPFLWRLLVDRRHQGRGIGSRVIGLLAERLREQGHRVLLTSWFDAPGGPELFYHRLGFVPTGEVADREVQAALTIA